MNLLARDKWLAAGLLSMALGGTGVVAGYGWLQEHDARLKAQSVSEQQERQIGTLKQQDEEIEKNLQARLAELEREKRQPVTPDGIVSDTSRLIPDLPRLLQVESVPGDPALPDGPKRQEVVVPNEDLAAIRDAEVSCQENSLKLNACTSQQENLKSELKLTESQRDEWKSAAKGGSKWHRALAAAKWFAIGAGAGVVTYAATHR